MLYTVLMDESLSATCAATVPLALTLPAGVFALLLGLLLLLAGGVVYLAQRLTASRRHLDLETEKVRRLRAQLRASKDLHPDREPVVERSDAEWAAKFDRLRQIYNKLYERHKALIQEYQRLHRYVQKQASASSPAPESNGAPRDVSAAPRSRSQQTPHA